jgi:hypothetical protein
MKQALKFKEQNKFNQFRPAGPHLRLTYTNKQTTDK